MLAGQVAKFTGIYVFTYINQREIEVICQENFHDRNLGVEGVVREEKEG